MSQEEGGVCETKLDFEKYFAVDCVGRLGGTVVMWRSMVISSMTSFSHNHVDLMVEDSRGEWRLTGYYAFPKELKEVKLGRFCVRFRASHRSHVAYVEILMTSWMRGRRRESQKGNLGRSEVSGRRWTSVG